MKLFARIFFNSLSLFIGIILVFVFSSDALSKEPRHQKPTEVTIGIYIMDVYDLDVRKELIQLISIFGLYGKVM